MYIKKDRGLCKKQFINDYSRDFISDERLSPDEELRLKEIASNLGIDYVIDSRSKEILNKYKLIHLLRM